MTPKLQTSSAGSAAGDDNRELMLAATNTSEPGEDSLFEITADVAYMQDKIVNLFFFGHPGQSNWTLIDAGLFGSAERIKSAAERRFGAGHPPKAIILTHGHFDHIGAVRELAAEWNVPVYAHKLELPFLTGRSSYPPPDPTVGGGMMASLSFLYPRSPIDLAERVQEFPADGSVPDMQGWQWIHTPGHTPGHVSLYRAADRLLIAGDAFVTTKQESALAVLAQRPEIHGPPAYFTPDWQSAHESVKRLAELAPEIAATGHGRPLRGQAMRDALQTLARDFKRLAVPKHGRYVNAPATADESGVISVPPAASGSYAKVALGIGVVALIGGLLLRNSKR